MQGYQAEALYQPVFIGYVFNLAREPDANKRRIK
jgi:hypothetical protein